MKVEKKPVHKYLRYSGLGFQLIATVLIFIWLGMQIDENMNPESHTFTLIGTLLGIVGAFYFMFKAVKKLNE